MGPGRPKALREEENGVQERGEKDSGRAPELRFPPRRTRN